MRNTITLALAAFSSAALAAQTQPAPTSSSSQQGPHGNATVVTGCLSAGPNNTFTLTAPAPARGDASSETAGATGTTGSTATTPVGSKVVKTVTYTLSPNGSVDLKSHVGHTVQVSGTETPAQASATTVESSTGTAANPPASTERTPTVQTTTQAQIVARHFTVDTVKMVADRCDLVK